MTRMWTLAAAALLVAGTTGAALAEGQPSGAQADQQQQMKGPPNANGYSKDQSGRSAAEPQGAATESPINMKGPPNANGYQK